MTDSSASSGDHQDTAPADSYAAAVAELDHILEELEDDALDVDVLAERVRRASELLRFCRSRIRAATDDVEAAVAALGPDAGEPRAAD